MGKKLQFLGLTLMHLEPLISKVLQNRLIVLYGHFYPGMESGHFEERQIRSNLRYVKEHCAVFPLEEALRRLYAGTLPPRSVALVVDDATASFYEHGWSLLAETQIPFTLAVVPGFIKADTQEHYLSRLMYLGGHFYSKWEQEPILKRALDWLGKTPENEVGFEFIFQEASKLSPGDLAAWVNYMEGSYAQSMSWEELKHLRETGQVTFASHSMSHSRFANVTGVWLQWELKRSAELMKAQLGVEITTFVYPFGERKNATAAVQRELENCHYQYAFLTAQGALTTSSNRYALPRMKIEVEQRLIQLNSSPASCSLIYCAHLPTIPQAINSKALIA